MIPSQNSPAATASHDSRELCSRCMKNRATSVALAAAMPSAAATCQGPSGKFDTITVSSVSASRAPKMTAYISGEDLCSGIVTSVVDVVDQVQDREQEDPHDVHEVPVQARHLHRR